MTDEQFKTANAEGNWAVFLYRGKRVDAETEELITRFQEKTKGLGFGVRTMSSLSKAAEGITEFPTVFFYVKAVVHRYAGVVTATHLAQMAEELVAPEKKKKKGKKPSKYVGRVVEMRDSTAGEIFNQGLAVLFVFVMPDNEPSTVLNPVFTWLAGQVKLIIIARVDVVVENNLRREFGIERTPITRLWVPADRQVYHYPDKCRSGKCFLDFIQGGYKDAPAKQALPEVYAKWKRPKKQKQEKKPEAAVETTEKKVSETSEKKGSEKGETRVVVFTSDSCRYCSAVQQGAEKGAEEAGLSLRHYEDPTKTDQQQAAAFGVTYVPFLAVVEEDGETFHEFRQTRDEETASSWVSRGLWRKEEAKKISKR